MHHVLNKFSMLWLLIILLLLKTVTPEYSIVVSPYHYFSKSTTEGYHGIFGIGGAYQKNNHQFMAMYNQSGLNQLSGEFATYDSVIDMDVLSISYRNRPKNKSIGPFSHNYGFVLATRYLTKRYYDYSDTTELLVKYLSKELKNSKKTRHNFVGLHLGTEITSDKLTVEFGIDPGLANLKPALNNYFMNVYYKLF